MISSERWVSSLPYLNSSLRSSRKFFRQSYALILTYLALSLSMASKYYKKLGRYTSSFTDGISSTVLIQSIRNSLMEGLMAFILSVRIIMKRCKSNCLLLGSESVMIVFRVLFRCSAASFTCV